MGHAGAILSDGKNAPSVGNAVHFKMFTSTCSPEERSASGGASQTCIMPGATSHILDVPSTGRINDLHNGACYALPGYEIEDSSALPGNP